MARRIIRGVTRLSEEEKRRQAFSRKQETDTQQMAALLKLVQGTPYSREVFHVFLKDALTVLYPKAWDTIFKTSGERHLDLLKTTYLYFFGRPLDNLAFAANPSSVYWSVFTEIEAQVQAGNHLKGSDFEQRQGYLREATPQQVTPEQLGYTSFGATTREANRQARSSGMGPSLWDNFLNDIRRRVRRTYPDYDPNPDMNLLRQWFSEGFGLPEAEERMLQHLFVGRPATAGSVEGLSDPQDIANVRNQNILRQREELRAFLAEVRTRMRQLHPGWSPSNDRREITRAYDIGRSVDSVVRQLHARIQAQMPGTPPTPQSVDQFTRRNLTEPNRQEVARRRGVQNRRGENVFIGNVLRELRDTTLGGTEVDRLNTMRRLYQQGHSVDTAVAEMLARFR